jgi:Domain of unknown function (DUF4234)
MSENNPTTPAGKHPETPGPFPPPANPPVPTPGYAPPQGQPYGQPYPAPVGQPLGTPFGQETGQIRSTGLCILLAVVTFGIYSLVWFYQTHDEMKRHTGHGLGGGLALVLAFFVGFVMPYITSSEVGDLYERTGQPKRVSWATGLWYFPGLLILVGPLVWFIKTNGALNAYWRSQGVH